MAQYSGMTDLLEVWQKSRPAPSRVTQRFPSVVIWSRTSIILHTVHNTTSSDNSSNPNRKRLVVELGLRGRYNISEHICNVQAVGIIWCECRRAVIDLAILNDQYSL